MLISPVLQVPGPNAYHTEGCNPLVGPEVSSPVVASTFYAKETSLRDNLPAFTCIKVKGRAKAESQRVVGC